MIDRDSGHIHIDGINDSIRPLMAVDQFLASPLSKEARRCLTLSEAIESSYGFPQTIREEDYVGLYAIAGVPFLTRYSFRDGELRFVKLVLSPYKPTQSRLLRIVHWFRRFDAVPAHQAKRFHDEWLRHMLGQERTAEAYSWGSITSVLDKRLDGSWIEIEYR